jgi:hypothetical protein
MQTFNSLKLFKSACCVFLEIRKSRFIIKKKVKHFFACIWGLLKKRPSTSSGRTGGQAALRLAQGERLY